MSKTPMEAQNVKAIYCEFINLVTDKYEHIISNINEQNSRNLHLEIWMLCQCIEYAKGIDTLLATDNVSSALALLRPMYESFYKGSWLSHCANQEQIKYFLDHDILATQGSVKGYKYNPTSTNYEYRPGKAIPMNSIVNHVVTKKGYSDEFKLIQKQLWHLLCGFTHVGVVPLYATQSQKMEPDSSPFRMIEFTYSMASQLLFIAFEQLIGLSTLNSAEKEKILCTAYEYNNIAAQRLISLERAL